MVDPKKLTTSMGKVNDACGILAKSMNADPETKIGMAVMLVSHSFGIMDNDHQQQHSDLGYCEDTFPIRIGILTGNSDELEMSALVSHIGKVRI